MKINKNEMSELDRATATSGWRVLSFTMVVTPRLGWFSGHPKIWAEESLNPTTHYKDNELPISNGLPIVLAALTCAANS